MWFRHFPVKFKQTIPNKRTQLFQDCRNYVGNISGLSKALKGLICAEIFPWNVLPPSPPE